MIESPGLEHSKNLWTYKCHLLVIVLSGALSHVINSKVSLLPLWELVVIGSLDLLKLAPLSNHT